MSIYCAMAGHKAAAATIRNAGHHFARCTRCGTDLIEEAGGWKTPPTGFRIVWRPAEPKPLELIAELPEPDLHDAADDSVPFETLEFLDEAPTFRPLDVTAELVEPETLELTEKAEEPEALDLLGFPPLPETVAPERRSGDRRAPEGSQPKFTGVDRRRGERRADFGKKAFTPPSRRAASGGLA